MKTVRVKIAVAVDAHGHWSASGWLKQDGHPAEKEAMDVCIEGVDDGEVRYWVEATLPLPAEAQSVEADGIRVAG